MICVNFEIDESALELAGPEFIEAGVIEQTAFEMPVSLVGDGKNLFGLPSGGSISLPLVGFAVNSRKALRNLQAVPMARVSIADAGWLVLERVSANKVRFSRSGLHDTIAADLSEASTAFAVFAESVGKTIANRVPAMLLHPSWDRWFPHPENSAS